MNPEFEDEKAINPFDFWKGANFKIKIRKVEGYQNYDKSEFESASPLNSDDDEMEEIWKKEYSLNELIDDSKFKTYEEIKNRLDKVLGLNGEAPRTTVEQAKFAPKKPIVAEPSLSEDDDIEYFLKLAEED